MQISGLSGKTLYTHKLSLFFQSLPDSKTEEPFTQARVMLCVLFAEEFGDFHASIWRQVALNATNDIAHKTWKLRRIRTP